MGTPPKKPNDTNTHRLVAWVTEHMAHEVFLAAEKEGLSLSSFVRKCVIKELSELKFNGTIPDIEKELEEAAKQRKIKAREREIMRGGWK